MFISKSDTCSYVQHEYSTLLLVSGDFSSSSMFVRKATSEHKGAEFGFGIGPRNKGEG